MYVHTYKDKEAAIMVASSYLLAVLISYLSEDGVDVRYLIPHANKIKIN